MCVNSQLKIVPHKYTIILLVLVIFSKADGAAVLQFCSLFISDPVLNKTPVAQA